MEKNKSLKCACGKRVEYVIYVCKKCSDTNKEFGFNPIKLKESK